MSVTTVQSGSALAGLGRAIANQFGALLRATVWVAENHPRMKMLERLSAMSDEELAARDLTRDRLVEHVFRNSGCF